MPRTTLEKYNEKRDFKATSEPRGKAARRRKKNLLFTVQKHDATRLHYDFRLEWDGVLWSWAVPKGPSYLPEDKRLAVRTEDHPISYHDYEGIIPANQYGAGPVMLWDTGTWMPLGPDPAKALEDGKLTFCLEGEKLRGEWALVRMRTKEKGRENWLLVKSADAAAADAPGKNFLEKTDYSVKTGRRFEEIAKAGTGRGAKSAKNDVSIDNLRKKYKSPQLATLVEAPPGGADWVHEVKYDGYRILAYVSGGEVRVQTRGGHDWSDKFPTLRDALRHAGAGAFVIDGEAVAIDEKGLSSFKALQNMLSERAGDMQAYFFDLLYWDGRDYAKKPFSERRQALEKLFDAFPDGPLYVSETLDGEAGLIIEKACDFGLEGIISKKKSAAYTQRRSKSWLKSKCVKRQEFIICGLVPASDMANAVGALHLGIYKGKKLTYAGKVGTGFDQKTARDLYKKLTPLARKSAPFAEQPEGRFDRTIWVAPKLLCEVKFAMWTETGKVRHASYQGLREDKPPEAIGKETPMRTPRRAARTRRDEEMRVAGVKISNAERRIFPEADISKGELAAFYAEMAEEIMPLLDKRPVSVVRCPAGIDSQCFFQRSKGKSLPGHIHGIDISHGGKAHDYFYVKNLAGLIELVQMGGIELHPWGVRIDQTEKPDRIIFDLDPDEDIPFEAVKLAAMDVRRRMEDLGLASFLKCTGGKGLHVTIPLRRDHEWDNIKTFTRSFAKAMVDDVPDAYTINMSKKKRQGKIFIDYLRNDFASTAVMDYCVRARPGAPVAVPLAWEELDGLQSARQFSIKDVLARKLKKKLYHPPALQQRLTREIMAKFS